MLTGYLAFDRNIQNFNIFLLTTILRQNNNYANSQDILQLISVQKAIIKSIQLSFRSQVANQSFLLGMIKDKILEHWVLIIQISGYNIFGASDGIFGASNSEYSFMNLPMIVTICPQQFVNLSLFILSKARPIVNTLSLNILIIPVILPLQILQ